MGNTSRRLRHLIREEEKTAAKIAELQEYLSEIRDLRKKEEDSEILKSIRSLKLGARDLCELLTGIRDGTVSMETREDLPEGTEPGGASSDGPAEDVVDPAGEKEEYGNPGPVPAGDAYCAPGAAVRESTAENAGEGLRDTGQEVYQETAP